MLQYKEVSYILALYKLQQEQTLDQAGDGRSIKILLSHQYTWWQNAEKLFEQEQLHLLSLIFSFNTN